MLDLIKSRCYIVSSIYDEEIKSLIQAGILDCIETGIKEEAFKPNKDGGYDDLALNCITNYVKAQRGNDRTDTDKYIKMYESLRNKMSLLEKYKAGTKNE